MSAVTRTAAVVAVVAMGLCVGAVGALAQPKPTIAVLGLEIIDDGAGIDDATQKFAVGLTEALRRRAMLGKGPYTLAPNSNKDLLELKLLSNCADEGRGCMSDIGKEMKAERLMYGKVERRKDGYQVSLKLLNTQSGAMERTLSDIVPFDEADRAGTLDWGRKFYNRLTGMPDTGSVKVSANANKGTVYIDGEVKTTLSAGSATISGIEEGEHTIAIESRGWERYEGSFTVAPGEQTEVSVSLDRKGGGIVGGKKGGGKRPGGTSRALFWTSVIATGASVTAFTVTGLQVRSLEDDKQTQFEQLVAAGGNTSGAPTDSNSDFTDVCAIANTNLDNANADVARIAGDLRDTCDKGRSRATLTNVFIGTSVATALAASYFYYKGYIEPGKSGKERQARGRKAKKSRVVVAPTVGPNVVGAGLEIQF